MTCRVFGPPVRSEQGLGVCELCYHGATEEQIAACEMPVDPEGLEAQLLEEFEQSSGSHGRTLVAFALGRRLTVPVQSARDFRRKVEPCQLIPLPL